MAIPPDRLTLLPFPQRWEGGDISLRAPVLPRGNPLTPLMAGTPGVVGGPAFADGALRLKARLRPGLDALPTPADATTDLGLGIVPPASMRTLFEELANQFDIDPAIEAATRNLGRPGRQIRKYLTESYRGSSPFAGPRTPLLAFDYVDVKDATTLVALAEGAIPIPTSRNVVVTLTPVGRDDPGLAYFGTDQARFGRGFDVRLRRAAEDERDLFVPDADVRRLRAILLQPDEAETAGMLLLASGRRTEAEDDLLQRLGAELGLSAAG